MNNFIFENGTFPDITANPTYAKVLEGAKPARKHQAGLLLGVGGGPVMDCCKAVITNKALRVKTGRDYPKCNPKFALMDPSYTLSISRSQMVSGGFDTFSHIMEIYFSGPGKFKRFAVEVWGFRLRERPMRRSPVPGLMR